MLSHAPENQITLGSALDKNWKYEYIKHFITGVDMAIEIFQVEKVLTKEEVVTLAILIWLSEAHHAETQKGSQALTQQLRTWKDGKFPCVH